MRLPQRIECHLIVKVLLRARPFRPQVCRNIHVEAGASYCTVNTFIYRYHQRNVYSSNLVHYLTGQSNIIFPLSNIFYLALPLQKSTPLVVYPFKLLMYICFGTLYISPEARYHYDI
jgi:hypothetical protein